MNFELILTCLVVYAGSGMAYMAAITLTWCAFSAAGFRPPHGTGIVICLISSVLALITTATWIW